MSEHARGIDLRSRAAIAAGLFVLRTFGRTWRIEVIGDERSRGVTSPVVFALWHGQMLPILFAHNGGRARVLISEHRDGEIIAHIVSRFGMGTVRGSSSRGGARALLAGVQTIREGISVAVTPDGPRGPRHSFAAGALVLAYRARVPIVPVTARIDRLWQLDTWDGFEIPKPFARIVVHYGDPVEITGRDVRDVEAQADRFAALMQDHHANILARPSKEASDARHP